MWSSGVGDGEPESEKHLMLIYMKIDTIIQEEYDAAGEEGQRIRKMMQTAACGSFHL